MNKIVEEIRKHSFDDALCYNIMHLISMHPEKQEEAICMLIKTLIEQRDTYKDLAINYARIVPMGIPLVSKDE